MRHPARVPGLPPLKGHPAQAPAWTALCAVLEVGGGGVAHTLAGHSGGTNGLAFLSGNSLVSVGEDGVARLWNVARATCLHELRVDAEGGDRRV